MLQDWRNEPVLKYRLAYRARQPVNSASGPREPMMRYKAVDHLDPFCAGLPMEVGPDAFGYDVMKYEIPHRSSPASGVATGGMGAPGPPTIRQGRRLSTTAISRP